MAAIRKAAAVIKDEIAKKRSSRNHWKKEIKRLKEIMKLASGPAKMRIRVFNEGLVEVHKLEKDIRQAGINGQLLLEDRDNAYSLLETIVKNRIQNSKENLLCFCGFDFCF